jgi:hypothetical protein
MSQNAFVVWRIGVSVGLSGCAGHPSIPYQELATAHQLQTSDQVESGRTPLQYTPSIDWRIFKKIIVEPVIIYTGSDNNFGDQTIGEVMLLKKDLEVEARKALSSNYQVSTRPAGDPYTLRVRLTLTGAEKNVPLLTTFSRFDIGLGSYNAFNSMRDTRGTFSGSVYFAVEVFNESDQLLMAYVTQQYPTVYNIAATKGSLTAAQAGIVRGAQVLATKLSSR